MTGVLSLLLVVLLGPHALVAVDKVVEQPLPVELWFEVSSHEVTTLELPALNGCPVVNELVLTTELPFVDTSLSTQAVPPESSADLPFLVDATELEPGIYTGKVAVDCASCGPDATCNPASVSTVTFEVVHGPPIAVELDVAAGEVNRLSVPIIHHCSPISYLLSLDSTEPWIDTDRSLTQVPPELQLDLPFLVDATDLEPGSYLAQLDVDCLWCGETPVCDPRETYLVTFIVADVIPPPDCSAADRALDEARGDLEEAASTLMETLKKAIEELRQAAALRDEALRKGADVGPAQAALERAIEALRELDRQFDNMSDNYRRAIEQAALDGDYIARERLMGALERYTERMNRERALLEEEAQRARTELEEAEQTAADEDDAHTTALEEAEKATEVLGDGLLKTATDKDWLRAVLVNDADCYRCDQFTDSAAQLAELGRLVEQLRRGLRQSEEEAQRERQEAEAEAEEAERELAETDREIARLEAKMAAMEARMAQLIENYSVSGLGSTPGSGPNFIGLLPGTDIGFYFTEARIELLREFLRSPRVINMRREYEEAQRRLEELREQRAEQKRRVDAANAPLQAGDELAWRFDDWLRGEIDAAGLEKNIASVLEDLDGSRSDCMSRLRDCIDKLQAARAQWRNADRQLGAERQRLVQLRLRLEKQLAEVRGARAVFAGLGSEELNLRLADLEQRLVEGIADLKGALEEADQVPEPPGDPRPDTVERCKELLQETRQARNDVRQTTGFAREVRRDSQEALKEIRGDLKEARRMATEIKTYDERMAEYLEALERKRAAMARLQELYGDDIGELSGLLDAVEEALEEGRKALSKLKELNDLLGSINGPDDLSEALDGALGRAHEVAAAMEAIERMGRLFDRAFAGTLTAAESTQAMADLIKGLTAIMDLVPGVDLPGVTAFLEFYGEALDAIAVAMDQIARYQVENWARLIGLYDDEEIIEMAPIGIREELRRALEIQHLLRELSAPLPRMPRPR